jgi:hypothetical protein
MKKLTLIGLFAALAFAQDPASNAPDCYFTATLTTATRTSTFNNTTLKCSVWKLQVVNLSNAEAQFEYTYSQSGNVWTIEGTTVAAATAASTIVTFNTAAPYLSVNLLRKGSGNVIVVLTGFYASPEVARNNVNSGAPDATPYTLVRDVASATITYVGQAKSIFDPVTNTGYAIFSIIKITSDGSGNVTSVQNADGDTEENNIWSGRAGLTYK